MDRFGTDKLVACEHIRTGACHAPLRRNMRSIRILAGLLAAALIGACGGTDAAPTTTPPSPKPTPDIEATVVAEVQARLPSSRLTPTAVPVSAEDKKAIRAFEGSIEQVSSEWDGFHREFDEWRRGLTTCEASSMMVSLRQFAATMGGIAMAARGLPRPAIVRVPADALIEASESEAEAFRQLRDGWQPNDASLSKTWTPPSPRPSRA